MLDVNNDLQSEGKYKAEDNFWLFIGMKGNTGNPKVLLYNFWVLIYMLSWKINL